MLVNNWLNSVSTHFSPPTSRIIVSQFPPARLNELILPFMGWSSSSLLKQQHFPESGILQRKIRAYWSKRRVVPQFFLELITTQSRFSTWCHRNQSYLALYWRSPYVVNTFVRGVPVRSHETMIYCPFSQGSHPSYDTTWEEAVRGCTIKGYNFFSINIMYIKQRLYKASSCRWNFFSQQV